ncbi:MAG: dihydrofolate reductase [Steroidobacteraceae bacterium]
MHLTIVVAVSQNGVIGTGNQLPWRLPDDLKRFKALTLGKPVVMGRKTYESIGRPLPGRKNIVITRHPERAIEGCVVVGSVDAALKEAEPAEEVILGGGGDLYAQLIDRVSTIHLTRVHVTLEGDVYFPSLKQEDWQITTEPRHPADERHLHAFTFQTLTRR